MIFILFKILLQTDLPQDVSLESAEERNLPNICTPKSSEILQGVYKVQTAFELNTEISFAPFTHSLMSLQWVATGCVILQQIACSMFGTLSAIKPDIKELCNSVKQCFSSH